MNIGGQRNDFNTGGSAQNLGSSVPSGWGARQISGANTNPLGGLFQPTSGTINIFGKPATDTTVTPAPGGTNLMKFGNFGSSVPNNAEMGRTQPTVPPLPTTNIFGPGANSQPTNIFNQNPSSGGGQMSFFKDQPKPTTMLLGASQTSFPNNQAGQAGGLFGSAPNKNSALSSSQSTSGTTGLFFAQNREKNGASIFKQHGT
jgi:hypothetical protein